MIKTVIHGEVGDYLEWVKADLGIFHDDDDERLERLIVRAVDWIESETGASFTGSTYEWYLPAFKRLLIVPRWPLAEIDSIKYFADGEQLTLDSDKYTVLTAERENGQVFFLECPPSTDCRPDAVTVTFTSDNETYPADFETAVSAIVGYLNENREGQEKDAKGIDRVIDRLRAWRYV